MKGKKKSEPPPKLETPLERWFRYIIVPALGILIGGSGILGYRTLTKDSSPKPPQKTQQGQPSAEAKESQLFFGSDKYSAHVEKEIVIAAGEYVTLHWDVKSEIHGKLAIFTTTASGTSDYSDQVNPYGSKTYTPTETTDYYLLDREGPFKATNLATIRVTVLR